MTNPKSEISALDSLRAQRRAAEGFRDAADAYLQAVEATPRPAVEVGAFYVTFDRSLVYVARAVTQCKCPRCTGGPQHVMLLGGLALPIELPTFAPAADSDAPAAEHNPDEAPRKFVCSILRGGHGIKEIRGEEPGDNFVIDAEGFTVMGANPNPINEVVSSGQLGLAGLSLCRRVNLKVVEEERPAQPEPVAEMAGGEVTP
jgi:hypothetical protein